MQKRTKEKKEKKEYTAFYLEPSIKNRVKDITNNPNSMFDDASTFYRYSIKKTIVEIEKEIQEEDEKS